MTPRLDVCFVCVNIECFKMYLFASSRAMIQLLLVDFVYVNSRRERFGDVPGPLGEWAII